MYADEVVRNADWAIRVAEENNIEVMQVLDIFKATKKYHGTERARNLIELWFETARSERDEQKKHTSI